MNTTWGAAPLCGFLAGALLLAAGDMMAQTTGAKAPNPANAAATIPPGFHSGDDVVFFGDSITHHNHYVGYATLFYATRYPGCRVRFHNAGVGGNRVGSAMARFRQDVAAVEPEWVLVLLGMNDGGRGQRDEQRFLDRYRKGMRNMLQRIDKETGAKVIFLLPTMFDHAKAVAVSGKENPVGKDYNARLVRFGDALEALAKTRDLKTVDLNAPMVRATERMRKKDPTASLTKEGVHPTPAGHFVMTHALLKGLGVTPVVSAVSVDARTGRAQAERAAVRNVQTDDAGLSFELHAEALPFPYPPAAKGMLQYVPFTRDLNRETVQVTNLPGGRYSLRIDDVAVGIYTADRLAAGLNLATNAKTPQHKQAVAAQAVNVKLQEVVKTQRDFRWMEKARGYKQPDGTYRSDAAGKVIIDEQGEVKWVEPAEWLKVFNTLAAGEQERLRRIAELRTRLYEVAQPKPHRYELTPVKE